MRKGFQFKQFYVAHEGCAQKVSTDSVLLGAWATYPSDTKRVLDVGCGSALLSLMAAQRTAAQVVGVEIEPDAVKQALENVSVSPWSSRIAIVAEDIRTYGPCEPFDVVISNPPFYQESLLPPDAKRCLAHSASSLPFSALLSAVARCLRHGGLFHVIVPANAADELLFQALMVGLYPTRCCKVRPKMGKAIHRHLYTLSHTAVPLVQTELDLLSETGERSAAYAALTADFYL